MSRKLRRVGRTLYICSIGHSEDHSDVDLTGAQAEWIKEETPDIASVLLVTRRSLRVLCRSRRFLHRKHDLLKMLPCSYKTQVW